MKNGAVARIFAGAAALLAAACSFEEVRVLPAAKSAAPPFAEIPIVGGANEWSEEYHPFAGAAAVDINGDGMPEIFAGGGHGYDDMLFAYRNGALENIIAGTGLSDKKATHGANSMDMDGDGDTDLLLARADGIFLYENRGGKFLRHKIPADLPPNSAPLNIAVGDIDGDGDGDLYVSAFVDFAHFKSATFNDPEHAKTNLLLRNDGGFVFTDITKQSGAAGLQNTFLASFINLDGGGAPDLVVAQNTGQVEIFRNLGGGAFASEKTNTGWGFWMGLAAGDIDKDGDQDLFFTNSGTSVPHFILELAGDATDAQPRNYGWILLQNDGNFQFRDITAESGLDNYGFAWGAAFEDLTLDGELELLVAQNYIKWFAHRFYKLPGKSFVRRDGAYYHAPGLGLETRAFSQSPLILDINGDGRPDVFWADMAGVGRAFLNRSKNNFIALKFPDAVSSAGARAHLVFAGGEKSYTREVHNNTGMSVDSDSAVYFGLGQKTGAAQLIIEWPDGGRTVIENPPSNQIIFARR
ncbi:MAG: CRTAC1 family protein [Betaproteobacteria bacterium]|nr:CRTAC1 family protein [Betaproteobacteria bacterium]